MRLRIILIVGAIALFVAGCGGGSDSTSGGTTSGGTTAEGTTASGDGNQTTAQKSEGGGESKPLSKTAFKTRINEICIQVPPGYERELEKFEKGGKKLSVAEKHLKAAVPPLIAAQEEMEAVVPPAGEEQNLEELIAALESAAKGLEAKPSSELSGPKSPFAEFQKLSTEFGFETCSGL
ncbi:MAG: hypothetical protein AB7V58_07920 [Solirubrobacterales bacterium]